MPLQASTNSLIADATMIINTSQSKNDCNRLVAEAQKHCLILPIKDPSKYLHEVLMLLSRQQFLKLGEYIEHMEYQARTQPQGLMGRIIKKSRRKLNIIFPAV